MAPLVLAGLTVWTTLLALASAPAPALANHQGAPSWVWLTAEKPSVTIPEPIRLTATAGPHMYGTGYSVVIRDLEGSVIARTCIDADECGAFGTGSSWSNNPNPQPRTSTRS